MMPIPLIENLQTYTFNRIIRLDTGGNVDTDFNTGTGFDDDSICITQDTNDKIYVGGSFNTYNGATANGIIRLNTDGTVDTGFNSGTGFNANVFSIIEDVNNKIYVAGSFTSYNGTSSNRIIRLNTDGTVDTGFITGTGPNGSIDSFLLEDTNGKIYAGGSFTTWNGATAGYITRLNTDGTVDTGFNSGTGFNANVSTILEDTNDKIYIGGIFTSYNGTSVNYMTRLNTDGTIDTGFNPGSYGFISKIFAEDSNGKIYISTPTSIIRLNTDGTLDTGFNNTLTGGFIGDIILGDDDKIYVAFLPTLFGGIISLYKLNTDGTINSKLGEFNNTISFRIFYTNNKIYCIGNFTTYNS